jgi:hypothetical protein
MPTTLSKQWSCGTCTTNNSYDVAQYDQDNGPPDDLYVIPMAYAPSASPGAVNNFPTFSRRLRMIRYPKDFKLATEKYDGHSDPSIWLKMCEVRGLGFESYTLHILHINNCV